MKVWRVRVDFFVPGEDEFSAILKVSELLEGFVDFGEDTIKGNGRLNIEEYCEVERDKDIEEIVKKHLNGGTNESEVD